MSTLIGPVKQQVQVASARHGVVLESAACGRNHSTWPRLLAGVLWATGHLAHMCAGAAKGQLGGIALFSFVDAYSCMWLHFFGMQSAMQ